MQITKELMAAIMAKVGNDAEAIAKEMQSLDEIRAGIKRIEEQKRKANEELKQKIEASDKVIAVFRKKCWHPTHTYHGDPAGGHDSFSVCDICGKHW